MSLEPAADRGPGKERHLTATGFVVYKGRNLLHWHRKNRLWLPFGGHVEANEDPLQCVLREVEEETGIAVEVFGSPAKFGFSAPRQLPSPVTILVERVGDGVHEHEHIDLIYFCRPLAAVPETFADPSMRWLDEAALRRNAAIAPAAGAPAAHIPEDVRSLALEAARRAREYR